MDFSRPAELQASQRKMGDDGSKILLNNTVVLQPQFLSSRFNPN